MNNIFEVQAFATPNSVKVLIALEEMELDYRVVRVDLRQGEQKTAAFKDRHAAFVSVALAPAAAECRRDHEIFEHAHAGKRLRNLKRTADAQRAALRRRQAGDVAPGINDAPGIWRYGAADDAEQRGLAGAVRPDNAERLAFCELKADAFRNDDGAEAFGDLLKRKN